MSATAAAAGPLVAATPLDRAHFFGYHDVTPWSPDNESLVVLRVDPTLRRLPRVDDVADVCLWDSRSGSIEPVARTSAWNFQVGARAQWLPDGRLVYNVRDGAGLAAEILDVSTGAAARIPAPIGAVSPDGLESVAAHFGRLANHWPAYGVTSVAAPGVGDSAPATDGLWRVDIRTGAVDLVLSLAEIVAFRGGSMPRAIPHFVAHPRFSPSGLRLAFLHGFFTGDGALYTRLLVCDRDGGNLVSIADEKASHFCWRDDRTIVAWCRELPAVVATARRNGMLAASALRPVMRRIRGMRGRLKRALVQERYSLISVDDPTIRSVVGKRALTVNGHPMYSADGRLLITDTYRDANGIQTLILYDVVSDTRTDVARFYADERVGTDDLKCDLHPRWDRRDENVCVDFSEAGVRQCGIVRLPLHRSS